MNNNMLRRIYVVFITVVAILISSSRAFILTTTTTTTTTTTLHQLRRQHLSSSLLFASPGGRSSSGIDNYIETANIKTSNRQRMTISGVSVSNGKGFWVMLKKASSSSSTEQQQEQENNYKDFILSIKVTNNKDDSFAASSAESLTVIQLISNVDMAGAVLPPELLGNMILSYCDDDEEDEECDFILQKEDVERSIIKKGVLVDQVRLQISDNGNDGSNAYKWVLDCKLIDMDDGRISFTPSWDILNDVCYRDNYENYDYSSSIAFISIALALRYKAPIVLETTTTAKDDSIDDDISLSSMSSTNSIMVFDNTDNNNEQFQKQFPNYATSSKLQNQSMRVEQKITQSYKIHQLTNALRIATERNDVKACMKIQKELDMYDNFDELPVIGSGSNDSDSNNQDSSLNQMQ